MPPDRLDQLAEQARRQTPVIGGFLRRRAAWRIWTRGTPDAVGRLATLASETPDPKLKRRVLDLLARVGDQTRIDAVVRVWALTRDAGLGELIERKRWLASGPLELRVLSALWAGHQADMVTAPPSGVPALLAAAGDADVRIAGRAGEVLRSLARADSRQAVCDAFLDHGSEPARDAALAAGYEPAVPARRAIFYFLTRQWDRYESLDFDGSALRAAYELAGPSLRARLADVARRAGRIDYVSAVAREGRKVGDLTDHEWESAVAVLAGGKRWDELWRLARSAPPVWAARIVVLMADAGRAAEGDERASWCGLQPAPDTTEGQAEARATTNGESAAGGASDPVRPQLVEDVDRLEPAARAWLDSDLSALPEPRLLDGHTSGVGSLVVTPDGRTCATSADGDRVLRIWSVADGHAMARQAGDVTCLAVSPDGRTLAAGALDGSITLWGLPEGRQIARLIAHVGAVLTMTALPRVRTKASADVAGHDGPALVSAGEDGRLRVFALPSGSEVRTLGRGGPPIEWLVAHPAARLVGSVDAAGNVRLWDPARAGLDPLWGATIPTTPVGLALADGGTTLACASKHTPVVRLFRCPSGKPAYDAAAGGGDATALLAPPKLRLLCVGGDGGRLTLIRAADGSTVATLDPPHPAKVTAMAASPDGHLLATGDAAGGVRLWGLPDGLPLAATVAGSTPVEHLAFAPNGGPLLAACADDPAIRAWEVEPLRLGRIPLADMTIGDLNRAQRLQSADGRGEASPFVLVAALLATRFEHDVMLGEVTGRIDAGEFDIELG